jgi:hypothetical protein
MSDFLQLCVKRRKKEGFLDLQNKAYKRYKEGSRQRGNLLKKTLEAWLIEDGFLSKPPKEADSVDPLDILDTMRDRICEISGHVWIEFVKDTNSDLIHGAASRPDKINAYIAEFTPSFDPNLLADVFGPEGGAGVLWRTVTVDHVVKLFTPLLEESETNRKKSTCSPKRDPAGALKGHSDLFSPIQLREQSDYWFKDKQYAYITPVWLVNMPHAVIESIMEERSEWRYSFTPEHYMDTDNCLTWASHALDELTVHDWLKTIQKQCGIDPSTLHEGGCKDCHIREQGRMSCISRYASRADKKRKTKLRRFSVLRVVK